MTPLCPHGDHPEGCPSCASSCDLLGNQQTSLTIVCAWCQQTIHGQRAEGAARGQISHSICFDCFADVFEELDPVNDPPPFSQKVHRC
jgi:hypothetical protein